MKLRDLEIFVVAPPPPGWGGRYWIFVKLTVDNGITGMGEVYAASVGPDAMKAVIAGEVLGGVNNLSDAYRAREAGNVKILGVFDVERSDFLSNVPTMQEQGFDIDNASVNYRGVMVPKGTPQGVIDKLAEVVPTMFENARVQSKMKAGGSPMKVMGRDEVLEMWKARQDTLKELLAGL